MKKILISACLLGTPCRYDGKSKKTFEPCDFGDQIILYPFCPEVQGGLPIPRVPAERVADKVIAKDGTDVTCEYLKGARDALALCQKEGIACALLKKNSPSCGKYKIYDGTHSGKLIDGMGTAAELLINNGIAVFTEDEAGDFLKK